MPSDLRLPPLASASVGGRLRPPPIPVALLAAESWLWCGTAAGEREAAHARLRRAQRWLKLLGSSRAAVALLLPSCASTVTLPRGPSPPSY